MSIGTNDLTQYTLAADRGNERVASLYDAAHPSVLRLVRQTCDAARREGILVGMCGELAGDPRMTEVLVGLGLDEVSMSAGTIPEVKERIRRVQTDEARKLADEVLVQSTPRRFATGGKIPIIPRPQQVFLFTMAQNPKGEKTGGDLHKPLLEFQRIFRLPRHLRINETPPSGGV